MPALWEPAVNATLALPLVIQGGMGVGVSGWRLANAVSRLGELGVVSGTGLDTLFVRRLQDGDVGGHLRRAMESFPLPKVAADVLTRYFRPEGRRPGAAYRPLAMYEQAVDKLRQQITVLANYVEVFLAKENHGGPVGINLLTKIQLPNLASLYGAMLAGVDYVLMGAGIPREIPGALDRLSEHRTASLLLDMDGPSEAVRERVVFDPAEHGMDGAPPRPRPRFLPIIASYSLAVMMMRKANGRVDGFVVEGPTAGGHNAPPRGEAVRNARGEPIYGDRDRVDLARLAELGLPFWLAGGSGSPAGLARARAVGAAGVQAGTLFALCRESGLTTQLKRRMLTAARNQQVDIRTDALASPTGFPFKVLQLSGTLSEAATYDERRRVCDLGYLRTVYRRDDGALGYRCASEPVAKYVEKGGRSADTVGRRCLCNALLADIGHGQIRPGGRELPLVTAGNELARLPAALLERDDYSAADVLAYLLGGVTAAKRPELGVEATDPVPAGA